MKKDLSKNISKGKTIKFEEMETPLYFNMLGGFIYQWCCNCGARHIWHIEVIEQESKNYIKVDCAIDRQVTKLRKFYNKQSKNEIR